MIATEPSPNYTGRALDEINKRIERLLFISQDSLAVLHGYAREINNGALAARLVADFSERLG